MLLLFREVNASSSEGRTSFVVGLLRGAHRSGDAGLAFMRKLALEILELSLADFDLIAEVRHIRDSAAAPGHHGSLLLAGVQDFLVFLLEFAVAELRLVAEIRHIRNRFSARGQHRRFLFAGVQDFLVFPLKFAVAELRLIAEVGHVRDCFPTLGQHGSLLLPQLVNCFVDLQKTVSSGNTPD